MFSSISKTTPQTRVSTSFTATGAMVIKPVSPFVITINGNTPPNPNSVSVVRGDVVSAAVTAPAEFTWHEFYYYTIDSVPQSFAVVNRSLYTIRVREEDAIKRWYLYFPTEYTLTYQSSSGANTALTLGNNFDNIPSQVHVVLDPLTNSVFLFSRTGSQLSKVQLPSAPIDYVKIPSKNSIVVLAHGGETYEIFVDSTSRGLAPLIARRDYSEFTSELGFVSRSPGEDLITYLRRLRNRKTIPAATCLSFDGTYVYAGGNGSVWVVDPSIGFELLHDFAIDEYVLNIAPLPNNLGALIVTQSQKVYTVDLGGSFSLIHQGIALCQPALFNGKIYIPEGQIGKLLVFDPITATIESEIVLPEFSPTYTTVVGGKMYVCGRDTERVLIFDANLNITERVFPELVTLVSVVDNTFIASHWMKTYRTLYSDDLFRIVGVGFPKRYGPVSHIGTNVSEIKTLGNGEVYAYTPKDSWLWLNGQRTYSNGTRGTMLVSGDLISLNYSARVEGASRTNCVVGDTAYDYDIEAFTQTYYPRNIDLGIENPQKNNIHTRSITLPTYFTPCRMSIEYGAIKVNDAYYYGDALVTAGDRVEVEIQTNGNSALPIFTIGARQFVIPVSTKPGVSAAITVATADLVPGSRVVNEITFGPESSLYDYIIPGYYDITVKKNNVDITGNYYQQFGSGDKLIVEFNSSLKKYDVKDVYIIGPTSYHFVALNIVDNRIAYLDYGNLQYPYTRQFDQYKLGDEVVSTGPAYGNVVIYSTPEIQYFTANLTVAGLASNVTGNISLIGGESFFVHNGNLITSLDPIEVRLNDQLALARNVLNYFESPIKITQHLSTEDEDGLVDIVVGAWGVINQTIVAPAKSATQFEFYVDPNTGAVDTPNVSTQTDIILDLIRPAIRSARASAGTQVIESIVDSVVPSLVIDQPNALIDLTNSAQSQIKVDNSVGVPGGASVAVFDKTSSVDSESPTVAKLRHSQRTVNLKSTGLLRDTAVPVTSSSVQQDKATSIADLAAHPVYSSSKTVLPQSYKLVFNKMSDTVIDGSVVTQNKQPSGASGNYDMQRLVLQIRAIPTKNYDLLRSLLFVVDGSKTEFSGNAQISAGAASPPVRVASAGIVPLDQMRTSFSRITSFEGQVRSMFDESTERFSDQIKAVQLIQKELVPDKNLFVMTTRSEIVGIPDGVQKLGMPSSASEILPFLLDRSPKRIIPIATWQRYISNSEINHAMPPAVSSPEAIEGARTLSLRSSINYIDGETTDANVPLMQYADWGRGIVDKSTANDFSGNRTGTNLVINSYTFNKSLFFTSGVQNTLADTDPTKISVSYTASKISPLTTSGSYTYNEITPLVITRGYSYSETPFSSTQGSYTYSETPFLSTQGSYTHSEIESLKNLINFPTTELPWTNVKDSYAKSEIPPEALSRKYMVASQPFKVFALGVGDTVPMDLEKNVVQSKSIDMDFAPAERNFAPAIVLPVQLITDVSRVPLGAVAAERNAVSVDYRFVRDSTAPPAPVLMQFAGQEHMYRMDLIQFAGQEHMYQLELMQYVQAESGSLTMADILWKIQDHSALNFVSYAVSIDFDRSSTLIKMDWIRNIPEYYNQSLAPDPEFDNGYVWEHDISVEYGAFATEADAVFAARNYTEFRPFMIMDTDLWSYRVMLDTGLVCNLPRGRYPVAWLIRGG